MFKSRFVHPPFPSIVFSNFTFRSRPYSQGYLLPVHSPMLMPRGQKKKKTSLDRAIYSILSAQQIKSIIDLNSQSDIKRRNYLIRRNKFSTNAGNYLKRQKILLPELKIISALNPSESVR